MRSLNSSSENEMLDDNRLKSIFNKWWPDLETKIDQTLSTQIASNRADHRKPEELLEEILALARQQSPILSDPDRLTRVVLDAYFAAEAKLSEAERQKVLALLGRWTRLNESLVGYLEKAGSGSLAPTGLLRDLTRFQGYVREARRALGIAIQSQKG